MDTVRLDAEAPAADNPSQLGSQLTLLQQYRASLEAFAEEQLNSYIARVQASPVKRKAGKEINDAVWRTISFNPFEILILDSPLMQRLRRVRQLGVAHWVYPCAGHSRLEHSIGVVYQVQRVIDSLNRDAGTGNHLPPEWVHLLRLTALVHDIGHGLMSHVVENALSSAGVTDQLLLEVCDELEVESCSLSEAAAYFMLGSDSIQELVSAAIDKTGHALPDEWQQKLCNAILGKPIHPRWPLLQELISGPFDADKLDYMSRDAQSAGIPNLTDIPRLIQKVRVAEVTASDLPPEIGRYVQAGQPSYFVQGILLSGGRTLDELMIARTLLFDKIYRHQKIRAIEAMISNVVSNILPLVEASSVFTLALKIGDEDFIALTKETLRSRLRPDAADAKGLEVAADIIARIRDRNLFVRAYAFAHTMPHDPFREDYRQKAGLEHLRRAFTSNPTERADLLKLIATTTQEIAGHASELLSVTDVGERVHPYIALDPFGRPTKMNEIARAYLVTSERRLVRFRADAAESPAWSNAYLMTRDIGYVFAAPEYAPAVYLACETVFRERYGIRTPPSAIEYAKVEKSAVEAIRRRLAEKGFYKGKAGDLRPMPDRLQKADVRPILKSVASRLSAFQGYAVGGGEEPRSINEDRLTAWLRQFRNDEEIDCALEMLQGIKMLTREEVRAAVESFLQKESRFASCYVCQLGGPRDSSSIITYFVQDRADLRNLLVVPLHQALTDDSRPILFVDDFLGTGRQAVTIVKHWISEPYAEELEEDHGPRLSEMLATAFKKRLNGFVFIYGTEEGKNTLLHELRNSGMDVTVHIHQDETRLPRAFDGQSVRYKSPEAARRFQERCKEIGEQLLTSLHSSTWTLSKISERVLGYGNNHLLLAFPYNVPTATLTLLWSEGNVDGLDWMPLLSRRSKT